MDVPKWIPWAGWSAVLGGLVAILLTPPFASAYFAAYPGYDFPPVWLRSVEPALGSLLTFASPVAVYNTYGRIYDLIYLLILPGVLGLHHLHQGTGGRAEKWGFRILVAGLTAAFIGVAGDYWADGAGFFLSLLGLLTICIGMAIYGIALLRGQVLPVWCGWLFIANLPGLFIFQQLIWHIPSGPTFLIAVSWVIVGGILALRKDVQPVLKEEAVG